MIVKKFGCYYNVYMKNYEIVNYPTKNDLIQLCKLDIEAYNEMDKGDLDKCLVWKKNCPEIYTALKFDGKFIGYINFVAITEDCYKKFLMGRLKDYELKDDDIISFKKGENYCLFMSIVIDKMYRDTEAIIRLSNAFIEKINKMKQSGVIFGNVICDCVSQDGEKFVKKVFNARFNCSSKNKTKIYKFKL